jgi:hypothetical protein
VAALTALTLAVALPGLASVAASATAPAQANEPPDSPDDYFERGVTTVLTDIDVGGDLQPSSVAMSDNGRFVVFDTDEALVDEGGEGGSNGLTDIYLVDRDPDGNGVYDESPAITWVSGLDGEFDPDGESTDPDMSADGRWVVFTSTAQDLVFGDPDPDPSDDPDVLLWGPREAPSIQLVSGLAPSGTFEESFAPSVSDSGNRVAFVHTCFELAIRRAAPPFCDGTQVLVQDLPATEPPEAVPSGELGLEPGESHAAPAISGNGATVVLEANCFDFGSACDQDQVLAAYDVATDTVAALPSGGHTFPEEPSVSFNGNLVAFSAVGVISVQQIYLLDRSSGGVTLVSSLGGAPGTDSSVQPSISNDGRYIAFATSAANLLHVPASTEFIADQIVVRDRFNPAVENELVTVESPSFEGDGLGSGDSFRPAVSSNAGAFADPDLPAGLPFVAFPSLAETLIFDDGDDDAGIDHDVFVRSFTSAALVSSEAPFDFGNVAVGTTRTRLVGFVADQFGFGPVAAIDALIEPDPLNFSVALVDCPAVQPGQTCQIVARYRPTTLGGHQETLVVDYDSNPTFVDGNEVEGFPPQAVRPLVGTGIAGGLIFSPPRISFGTHPIGLAAPSRTTTVSMRGGPGDTGTVFFTEITLIGPAPGDYTIDAANCLSDTGVQLGDPCVVTVTFRPTAIGARNAFVEFRSGTSGQVNLVELTGDGAQPTVAANPAVVRSGGVLTLLGAQWPPGSQVAITMQGMPAPIIATVSPDGSVELPAVIFHSNNFGPRMVTASVVGNPAIASQPLFVLVQAPSTEPGDFVGRR